MSNLPANKKLTDKQQLFLDNILTTQGDLKLSAELAGYSGNHYQVIKSLKEEIVELASNVLAREAPKAAFKLVEVMTAADAIPQANVKLQAAQTVLDRVGLGKKEKFEISFTNILVTAVLLGLSFMGVVSILILTLAT